MFFKVLRRISAGFFRDSGRLSDGPFRRTDGPERLCYDSAAGA